MLVRGAARGRTFDTLPELPPRHYALVLGTGKYLSSGRVNRYYRYRIEAAAAAFHAGKVEVLLLSGDGNNGPQGEPGMMQADLLRAGVPEGAMLLDGAGFRTLDSVQRAARVYGLREFTVISQQFHNQRAIFLARALGLEATALNAQDVTGRAGVRVQLREVLARVLAVGEAVLVSVKRLTFKHGTG